MEKLFELLAKYWEVFKAFQIVDPYEGGVHLRNGHYLRTLSEGLWWKLPVLDSFYVVGTAVRCESLLTQTIGRKVVSTAVRYRITDPKHYVLELGDDDDYLQNVTLGLVRPAVDNNPHATASEIEELILPKLRKAVNRYGFKVYDVFFVDFGDLKSLRILLDSMKDE